MNHDFLVMKAIIQADYARRVKTFRALPLEDKDIIVGDSMIAYFNQSHYGFDSWINMGIAGDTTEGVMKRLDAVLRLNPKRVILNIGSNDLVLLNHRPEEIVKDILDIVETLKPFMRVYVLTVTPVNATLPQANQTYIGDRQNKDILSINQLLKQLIPTDLIETSTPLLDQHQRLDETFTKDGIHLNDKGYQLFSKIIKNYLFKQL